MTKATTVAEVMAGEARSEEDLEMIASTIVNRAQLAGVSLESIVQAPKQFDAYGKSLPAGTTKRDVARAQAILDRVVKEGVPPQYANALGYARDYAVDNLPKSWQPTGIVTPDKHVVFTAPPDAYIATAQGYVAPKGQLGNFIPDNSYSPPQNTSNPFEAQPGVGIAGHAYEGLLGSASPGDGLLGTQSAPQLAGGTAQDTLSRWAAGQDFGAKQQAAQRDYEAKRQMSANSAPAAAPSPSRFGGLLDAPTPGISPERYGTTTQDMALAHLMSGQPSFDPSPNQQFASAGATQGAFQSPSSTINKMVDGMMNTPGAVAEQPADTAPDPAAVAALQGAPAFQQQANIKPDLIDMPQEGLAPPSLGFMPAMQNPRAFTPWDAPLTASMAETYKQQTVSPPNEETAQTFPAQPEQPSQLDAALASPAMKKVKDVLGLLNPMAQARGLLGDPIGKLAGLLGGPAGVSPANIDAGSGMHAMEQGMYGERGTFGRSLSNPGAFSVSRGPNQGYDLHNAQGVVTPYDSSGHIMANRDTMRAWGGLLDHLFGGGLLDKPDRDKGKDRGGINGSGYSGLGLY